MVRLAACDSPFSLDDLAVRIRKSSNFRFNWQFYQSSGMNPESTTDVRAALEVIIATPALHEFLKESFDPMYADTFEVQAPHAHARIEPAAGAFENVLACAAGDHLGAYSWHLRDATAAERRSILALFGRVGEYLAYELSPGSVPECETCRDHTNHLFSTWFFGVAWDWCLFAIWPQRNLFWMGCLTDTD